MSSNNKIPFGLKNNKLVSVSEVESGLACECVCPSCHRKLQANKGKIKTNYFSHDPSEEMKTCEGAFETSIHLMAKQILSEEGFTIFPNLEIKMSQTDINGNIHTEERTVVKESRESFTKVELEKRLEEIRPDIIAYQKDVPFLIEVAVTHFVDNKKKNIIRSLALPAVEIDLSSVSYLTTKEELKKIIVGASGKRKWISNPKAIAVKNELKASLEKKVNDINSGIYKSRSEITSNIKRRPVASLGNLTTYENTVGSVDKEYETRWFICRHCLKNRELNKDKNTEIKVAFSIPLKDAPYSINVVSCPECGYKIAAK